MSWLRRSQRDFEDEIRSHLELETDRLIAEGMTPLDAQAAARRKFGNVARAQERYSNTSPWLWLEHLAQDVRYATRMLRKSPVFSVIAIFTLALGIGANTAVFSILNGVLLSGLPYREPQRLVQLWETLPGMSQIMVAYPDYKDWVERTRVFDGLALYNPFSSMTVTGGELPERAGVGLATGNLFDVLGVTPVAGRGFRADDDRPGAERVVILTSAYWEQHYASDPGVLGKVISLDGDPYTIVGVLPPVVGIGNTDLWIPIGLSADLPNYNRGNHPGLIGVGRLKPGVTLAQMNADLARVSREIVAEHPQESAGIGAGGDFFQEQLVRNIRPALKLLTWAVLCVLLIACVNVANLLLGRSTGRRKEIALRLALGASDSRILRLLLTESLLLAIVGGALGVGLAYGGVGGVVAMRPPGMPRLANIHINVAVLAFAAGISILTGLVFGLLPARHASRADLNDPLRETGRGTSAGRGTLRLRGLLMTAEVAMALMLLIGAGLLVRSFERLTQVNTGVDARGVTTGWINLPAKKYPDEERQRLAMDEILRRVRSVPGVTSAAMSSAFPTAGNMQNKITFEGHPRPIGEEPLLGVQVVTPDYFSTVKMRVVRGRGFAASDVRGSPDVVWIDETVAKKYFPGEDPLGKRLIHGGYNSTSPPWTVVGIVNDVLNQGLDERATGTLYLPFDQQPQSWMGMLIRSSIPLEQVLPAVRRQIASFDSALPLSGEETLEHMINQTVGTEKFIMFVLAVFAVVALILAAVGVYGVIAYFVAQRSHEIGIRMALGAQQLDIVSLVSRRVLTTAGLGIVIGLVAAKAASGLMASLVFEVTTTDAGTYALGAVGLILVAGLAAVVPTLRATRVNPAGAMRAE